MITIPFIVNNHRKSLGLSATEYGKRYGVGKSAVWQWETGRRLPNNNRVLEDAFNTYYEKGSNPPSLRSLIQNVVERHIVNKNSFIDDKGNNHYIQMINEISEILS